MKRWVLILIILIVCTGGFYLLIPSLVTIRYQAASNCTPTAAARQIIHQDRWNWWPGEKLNKNVYSFENCRYDISKILLNGIQLTISKEGDSLDGFIQFEGYGKDSTRFTWSSGFEFSANPVFRISEYFQFKKLNNSAKDLVDSMQHYFNLQQNVYGMEIREEKITDTSLISMKNTYDHYPAKEEIYSMIDSLNDYIRKNNGQVNNYPMMNVRKTGESVFEVMVAVPTKWDLPSQEKFQLKKMVLGNILTGEVTGGVNTVRDAEREITNYANDYRKVAPAIPFQSLVTDRVAENDTSKWITRVYFPVF